MRCNPSAFFFLQYRSRRRSGGGGGACISWWWPATWSAGDGTKGGGNTGGEAGSDTDPGIGGYRLKDFYLECALDANRQRTGPDDFIACGQPGDVRLADREGRSGAQVFQRLAVLQGGLQPFGAAAAT